MGLGRAARFGTYCGLLRVRLLPHRSHERCVRTPVCAPPRGSRFHKFCRTFMHWTFWFYYVSSWTASHMPVPARRILRFACHTATHRISLYRDIHAPFCAWVSPYNTCNHTGHDFPALSLILSAVHHADRLRCCRVLCTHLVSPFMRYVCRTRHVTLFASLLGRSFHGHAHCCCTHRSLLAHLLTWDHTTGSPAASHARLYRFACTNARRLRLFSRSFFHATVSFGSWTTPPRAAWTHTLLTAFGHTADMPWFARSAPLHTCRATRTCRHRTPGRMPCVLFRCTTTVCAPRFCISRAAPLLTTASRFSSSFHHRLHRSSRIFCAPALHTDLQTATLPPPFWNTTAHRTHVTQTHCVTRRTWVTDFGFCGSHRLRFPRRKPAYHGHTHRCTAGRHHARLRHSPHHAHHTRMPWTLTHTRCLPSRTRLYACRTWTHRAWTHRLLVHTSTRLTLRNFHLRLPGHRPPPLVWFCLRCTALSTGLASAATPATHTCGLSVRLRCGLTPRDS